MRYGQEGDCLCGCGNICGRETSRPSVTDNSKFNIAFFLGGIIYLLFIAVFWWVCVRKLLTYGSALIWGQ